MANDKSPDFTRLTAMERLLNRAYGLVVGLGLGFAHNYVLETRGRKSGRVYTTPVNLLEMNGRRYLCASRGETAWVKNARAAAAVAVPARQGRRAGQPVHPRQISFTAARRAVITSVRSGAATASLPAALTEANRDAILAGLARRRDASVRGGDQGQGARSPPQPLGEPGQYLTAAGAQEIVLHVGAREQRPLLAERRRERQSAPLEVGLARPSVPDTELRQQPRRRPRHHRRDRSA